MADEDFCGEEIKALLHQAAERLLVGERATSKNMSAHLNQQSHIEQITPPYAWSAQSRLPISKLIILRVPALCQQEFDNPYIRSSEGLAQADSRLLLKENDRQAAGQVRRVGDPSSVKDRHIRERKATAGKDWFDLPRNSMTPEVKRDLRLLKMRGVLDPKRHYKQDNMKDLVSQFFQVGTVVQAPTEFFSARISNKDRKSTFVDEVIAAEASTRHFKRKYDEVQTSRTSGKKAFYRDLQAKRSREKRKH